MLSERGGAVVRKNLLGKFSEIWSDCTTSLFLIDLFTPQVYRAIALLLKGMILIQICWISQNYCIKVAWARWSIGPLPSCSYLLTRCAICPSVVWPSKRYDGNTAKVDVLREVVNFKACRLFRRINPPSAAFTIHSFSLAPLSKVTLG